MHHSEGESSSTHHRNTHVHPSSWVRHCLLFQATGLTLTTTGTALQRAHEKTQTRSSNSTKNQKQKLQDCPSRDEQKEVSSVPLQHPRSHRAKHEGPHPMRRGGHRRRNLLFAAWKRLHGIRSEGSTWSRDKKLCLGMQ